MPWPPHRTLYELGRGGMGVVELAQVGDRLVAIKRILPYRGGDAQTRSAFLREARLLARIDHPNVVRALGVDEGAGDDPPALMMQYVAGVLLKDLLAASPSGLPVPVAARLGSDVARGLHAAHELRDEAGRPLNVVHRDVSPHNVLVTFDGHAVLLDFGVAKINDATRTVTGEVKGKLAYMAPEQAMADPVDRRSDLYALGAVLYEMLSGRRMHGEGTDLEILKRMVSERPAPLGSLRPEVPDALARLVARMTDESPERRPDTGDEVAAALDAFAGGAGPSDVAAYLEGALPGERERHDRRLAEARASAPHGERGSLAGGEAGAPSGPPASTGLTARFTPASSAGAVAPSRPGDDRASASLRRSTPGDDRASASLRRPAPGGGGAKPAGLGQARLLALVLASAGLGLGVLGVAGLVSERQAPALAVEPSTDAPRPLSNQTDAPRPLSNQTGAPPVAASSPSAPGATIVVSSYGAPGETGALASSTPAAASSPQRTRPPVRKPPASGVATSGAVRPPPGPPRPSPADTRVVAPLPVDTHAIGDDDR